MGSEMPRTTHQSRHAATRYAPCTHAASGTASCSMRKPMASPSRYSPTISTAFSCGKEGTWLKSSTCMVRLPTSARALPL